jgi:2-methylisocitrate lyase-like PEP mutase family enzyme
MASQAEKAEAFRALHRGKHLIILPNAWDVPSARMFENSGFKAVATSSAGLMVSLGYQDGEEISLGEFLLAIKRITRVLSVPLSVDLVAGFGTKPDEIATSIKGVIEAGASGINIEDFTHATKKLTPVNIQVEKIRAILRQCDLMKVPLVINARTDALRYSEGGEETRLKEAITRANEYKMAGADCVYPMGLTDAESISRFVKEVGHFPVNVMIRKGLPTIAELENLGIKRVSFGPGASYATMGLLKRISKEVQENGTYHNLIDGAITFDELNSLAIKAT